MRRKWMLLITAIVLSLCLVFAACGGNQSTSQGEQGSQGGEQSDQGSSSQGNQGDQENQGGGSQGGSQGSQGNQGGSSQGGNQGSQGGSSQGGNQGGGSSQGEQDHEDDKHTYFTVTFDSEGGSEVASVRVMEGNPVPVPVTPTRENFDFDGWYRSADEGSALWDFERDRVNSDLTLYAHWTEKAETQEGTETLTYETNSEGAIVTGDEGQAANIVIPEVHEGRPVVGIADSAFAYSRRTSDILSVTIPDSVKTIGKNAFHNQDALVEVEIGTESELESIGNNAFSGNSALKSIYLPAGLTALGDDVFNNCGGLDSITVASENARYSGEGDCLIDLTTHTLLRGSNHSVIPETVQTIGVAAFREATLKTLEIPTSVTAIEKYAIQNSAIEKVVYEGTTQAWDSVVKSPYWNMGKKDVKIVCSDTVETSHVLVAYFSCTGNTEKIAEYIAEATGGTLYEITPEQPYTAQDLNYNQSGSRANEEQNDPNARPAIQGSVDNMSQYDVVYLGYPIWWGKAPKIIDTFLESYDFSGKTIIPFCTSGSSGIAASIPDIQALASDATWMDGKRFSGSAKQSEVESWVEGL